MTSPGATILAWKEMEARFNGLMVPHLLIVTGQQVSSGPFDPSKTFILTNFSLICIFLAFLQKMIYNLRFWPVQSQLGFFRFLASQQKLYCYKKESDSIVRLYVTKSAVEG